MIIKLNSLDDLKRWWPFFQTAMSNLDPKGVKMDPSVVEQHVLNILSIPLEGWVGLHLDNEDTLSFLIMKRKLSLLPTYPEYESLLSYFAPSHRRSLEALIYSFEEWAYDHEATSYEIHTNHPQLFYHMGLPYQKHSITLKRDF